MANKKTSDPDAFLKQTKQQLDESVNTLNADIKDKLFSARRKIIAEHHNSQLNSNKGNRLRGLIPLTTMAVTASVILGIFIQSGIWQSNDIKFDVELELVSTLDNIELYNDLEFYQWLAENELHTG